MPKLFRTTHHFIVDSLCVGGAVVSSIVGEQLILPLRVVDLNGAAFRPHLHHLNTTKQNKHKLQTQNHLFISWRLGHQNWKHAFGYLDLR